MRAALTLARLRLLPGVLGLPVLGWAWAHWDRALPRTNAAGLVGVLGVWTLLHVGTMWWNAAFDRDEGPVLLGRSVPVPNELGRAGCALLGAAALAGAALGPAVGAIAATAAALGWAYSAPGVAWKARPVAGLAVNVVGYGVLSPAAGWIVVGRAVTPRTVVMAMALMAGIAAAALSAQAFQEVEDRARGYRTPVAVWGARRTVMAARLASGISFAIVFGLAAWGWLPRELGFGVPFAVWVDRHFARWQGAAARWGPEGALGFGRRLALAGSVLVLIATAVYVRDALSVRPVAGMGTVAGWPEDRPRLPPAFFRRALRSERSPSGPE